MPLPSIKKSLFFLLLYPSICLANYIGGYGTFEYNSNLEKACQQAFIYAKQDAVRNSLEVEIQKYKEKYCKNVKKCSIDIETYINFFGEVKDVIKEEYRNYEIDGTKVCISEITAVVESLQNKTSFSVVGKTKYNKNEELEFSYISNTVGFVTVYNYYDGKYTKIYEDKITTPNEFKNVKSKGGKLVASLPKNKDISYEFLIFVFSKEKFSNKTTHNDLEFANILFSLDSNVKRTVFKFITVGKKS